MVDVSSIGVVVETCDFDLDEEDGLKKDHDNTDHQLAKVLQEEEYAHDEGEVQPTLKPKRMSKLKVTLYLLLVYTLVIVQAIMFALFWVTLSVQEMESHHPTWVKVYELDLDTDSSTVFCVAFHWALSKFTLTSIEPTLTPQNMTEKRMDFVTALFACFFVYPLLGAMVALASKLLPIFPGKNVTRKRDLWPRAVCLGFAMFVQWMIFAGAWLAAEGSDQKMVMQTVTGVPGQFTGFTDQVFRHSAEKDFGHALHWAFCQFSLASITVVPPSYAERLVAIFVQLIGLLTMYPLIAACSWTIYKMFPFAPLPRSYGGLQETVA